MKDMNFKLHLYSGESAKKDINIIKNFYKNVNINMVKNHLIEHYNIIVMKDKKVFIWYEPNHIVKNQVDIFLKNCDKFLREHGFGILALKARSVDVTRKPKDVFKEVRAELEKIYPVVDYKELQPFEQDHALFVIKKK
jgi:fibrillarin-like rRNA methylase